jgi:hypothetical protein
MNDLAATIEAARAASIQNAFGVLVSGLADANEAAGAPARFAKAVGLADRARELALAAYGLANAAAPTSADRPIVIRLVTCGDPVSAIIRRGETGFWASHVEALTPDGFLLGAHADGGVAKRPRDYDAGQWTLELYVTVPATPAQQAAFWAALEALIGHPYDMDAIKAMEAGVLTGMAKIADNAGATEICSAAIKIAFLASGHAKSAPASIRLTTPRDIAELVSAYVALDAPHRPGVAACEPFDFDPFTPRPGAMTC